MRKLSCLIITLCVIMVSGVAVFAGEKGVALDKDTFPEECIRTRLDSYDKDGDGYLSQSELKKITKLEIYKFLNPDEFSDESIAKGKNYYKKSDFKFNFKGLGELKYLDNLQIYLAGGMTKNKIHYASIPQNIGEINKLKRLSKLHLSDLKIGKLDTTKLKKLRNLEIYDFPILKKLSLNSGLTKITLEAISTIDKYDFSKMSKLKELHMWGVDCSTVKFGNNKKLKMVDIDDQNGLTIVDVPKTKSIDFTSLKNLTKLYLRNYKSKNINLSKNKKLKELSFTDCKYDKIDVRANKKLKEFSIDGKGIKKVLFAKNNKIETVRWANAGLKKFSLKPFNKKYLKAVILWGNNKLKSVNIKGYNKLETVYTEEGVKIIKNASQNIDL